MAIPVELLVGPVAGLAILLWVARELWKAHRESDKDVRDQRDALSKRLDEITGLLKKGSPR